MMRSLEENNTVHWGRALSGWIFFVLFIFQGLAWSNELDFSSHATIRIYISKAPGMGHQSASVVVMRRLRQLGFDGEFEVIYNDQIASKINTLLPGFDSQNKDWQEIKNLNIKLISESQFLKIPAAEVSLVDLAISGADDNQKNMTPEKLHSLNYLLLEPLGWGDSIYFQANQTAPRVLTEIRNLGFQFESNSSEEMIQKTLEDLKTNPEFFKKSAGLKNLFATPSYLSAIYGIGLIGNMPEKMRIWVEAILSAQKTLKLDRPVILPIISPLNTYEMEILKWELSRIQAKQPGLRAKQVQFTTIEDAALNDTLKSLKKGDILLVQVGRIPQVLFEALFEKSRLPVLVAGKNAMNLAQNLGKPYLNTVRDYGFSTDSNSPTITDKIATASDVFSNSQSEPSSVRKLSAFVKEAMTQGSAVSDFFKSLAPKGRDKVAEALKVVLEPSRKCSRVLF